MIRVTPTKLQLKAEDAQEYERHKATWNTKNQNQNNQSNQNNEKSAQQEEAIAYRNSVRARLGVTPSTTASK